MMKMINLYNMLKELDHQQRHWISLSEKPSVYVASMLCTVFCSNSNVKDELSYIH